jgi:hypothetical protein
VVGWDAPAYLHCDDPTNPKCEDFKMTRPVHKPSRRAAIKAGLAAGAGLAISNRLELFAEEVAR